MSGWSVAGLVVLVLALVGLAMSLRVVRQYERGVVFRLGRLQSVREPGLRIIIRSST